jgi:hypothetical protein
MFKRILRWLGIVPMKEVREQIVVPPRPLYELGSPDHRDTLIREYLDEQSPFRVVTSGEIAEYIRGYIFWPTCSASTIRKSPAWKDYRFTIGKEPTE